MRRWYLTLCAVTFGWGTIPVVAREVHLPASLIVAGRVWTAVGCLAVMVWWRRRVERRQGRPSPAALFSVRPWLSIAVGVVLACHWLALFAAYKRAPVGTVILIVYLAPIGVAMLAPAVIGERLGRPTVVALLIATSGFALLAAPAVRTAGAAGLLYALVAAVLFIWLIVLSKPLASPYGGLRLAFMEMGVSALVLVPVAALSRWSSPDRSWLWLLLLGGLHTAVGTSVYLAALARLPATHVGILGYLEPVGVVIWAWVFLSERPGVETIVGGLIVVAGGILLVIREGAGSRDSRVGEVGGRADSQMQPVPSHP